MRGYAARRGRTIPVQVREVGSGAAKREARETLLEAARRGEIDVVWDGGWTAGAGRSRTYCPHCKNSNISVSLRVADRGAGPDYASGSSNGGLLAVFAAFEREILAERTRAGLAHSRQNGTVSADLERRPHTRSRSGNSFAPASVKSEIARRLQIGCTSVRRILEDLFREGAGARDVPQKT